MKKLFSIIIIVSLFALINIGCQNTQAEPYKTQYEQQVAINGSLTDKISQLGILVKQKTDSLKLSNTQLNDSLSVYKSQAADYNQAQKTIDSLITVIGDL